MRMEEELTPLWTFVGENCPGKCTPDSPPSSCPKPKPPSGDPGPLSSGAPPPPATGRRLSSDDESPTGFGIPYLSSSSSARRTKGKARMCEPSRGSPSTPASRSTRRSPGPAAPRSTRRSPSTPTATRKRPSVRTPIQEETTDAFSTDGGVKVRRHVGKKPKEATPDHGGRPRTTGTPTALDALPNHNHLTGKPRRHLEPVFFDGYSAGTPHIINQVGRGTSPSASTPLRG